MPEINLANVEVWKRRFRRKYATDVEGLKTLSDQIASEAGEVVTITQSNMEGGSASGVITGNKLEMLAAAEDIIAELDNTTPQEVARGLVIRFSP